MKNFFAAFAACYILSIIVLSLFSDAILGNFWVTLAVFSLFPAALLTSYMSLAEKTEQLENRLEALEQKQEQ